MSTALRTSARVDTGSARRVDTDPKHAHATGTPRRTTPTSTTVNDTSRNNAP